MDILKFDDFTFNSTRYRLSYKGKNIALRPKAVRLLHLLITNRDRVVSKSEIFSTVWGSTFVRDHLLFQLISELRKAPFKGEYVRTEPNHGYQWNVATRVVRLERSVSMPLAACFVLATICGVLTSFHFAPDTTLSKSAQLPAHSAFSKGIIALELGKTDEAIEWFQFAVHENPASAESSLFLAEALFQQGRVKQSAAQLQTLLQLPTLDSYNKMSANDLLSRIHLQRGSLHDALRYAGISSNTQVLGQCSINAMERRTENLIDKLGVPNPFDNDAKVNSEPTTIVGEIKPEDYDGKCDQLNQSFDETSLCVPDISEINYAFRYEKVPALIS